MGGIASASSVYGPQLPVHAVNNGERAGTNFMRTDPPPSDCRLCPTNYAAWADGTPALLPDWVQIQFDGAWSLDRIVVYTLQDNYIAPVEPTDTMTFTRYGITDYAVQGWNGSTWVTLGSVAGNNLVKRTFTFEPFRTTKVRVLITGSASDYSYVTEIEAFGTKAPYPIRTNVAAAVNGGAVSASSEYGVQLPAPAAIDQKRSGAGWMNASGWNDATPGAYPDWLEVQFNGLKSIDTVIVYTLQDNYAAPSEPTDTMTFTRYGLTDWTVEGWDGTAWVTLATVTGNNLVKRTSTFAPMTTNRIRINISRSQGIYSHITEVEAWGVEAGPPAGAMAHGDSGARTSASSEYGPQLPAYAANDGERSGAGWMHASGWNDATPGAYPDWLLVTFPNSRRIDRVVVYTLQDAYASPAEPTDTMTFTQYGITDYVVQGWDGASWVTLGSVSGNRLVKKTFTFEPFTTTRIRVLITGSAGVYSHITEVEAFGVDLPPPPTVPLTNFALAANGGAPSASSEYGPQLRVQAVNDGERAGANWMNNSGWNDATPGAYPDWVEVQFNGLTNVEKVTVYTLQDNYAAPSEPTDTMTFTQYGLTDWTVEGWDGAAWVTLATVTGNNLVKRTSTFAPMTTNRIRINISRSQGIYSHITEIEAWGTSGGPRYSNYAANWSGTASASSQYGPQLPPAAAIDGEVSGTPWMDGSGWNDGTPGVYPDWLQVAFPGPRTIHRVVVYTLQDTYNAPSPPTDTMTFTKYGIVDFDVQAWNGSAWTTVASVTGNDLVKRTVTFLPVTTDRMRILVTRGAGVYSHITEVEMYGT